MILSNAHSPVWVICGMVCASASNVESLDEVRLGEGVGVEMIFFSVQPIFFVSKRFFLCRNEFFVSKRFFLYRNDFLCVETIFLILLWLLVLEAWQR